MVELGRLQSSCTLWTTRAFSAVLRNLGAVTVCLQSARCWHVINVLHVLSYQAIMIVL